MLKTIAALFIFITASLPVVAQDIPSVEMRLIPGETDDTPLVGLVLTPEPGWRIYAPPPPGGEAFGFVPEMDWTGSENLLLANPVWPLPEKSYLLEQPAYTYSSSTIVPIHLTMIDPHKPIKVRLKVQVLSCSTLCVPVEKELRFTLVPGGPEDQRVYRVLQDIEEAYEGTPLLLILLIALLGGFILNFMPCVLPVLSLKVMHFASHKNQVTSSSFLMTAFGILFSFLVLAFAAILLKASGEAVGWGMHFQNPYFLVFLLVIIVLFAANMLGLYEFHLPGAVGDKASHVGERSKLKDFFTGVFATLLATPCSAPFVGTSLSFALARDPLDILAVFMALGLGFASPYVVATMVPSHKLPLPKPGVWMMWLQRLLGVGLLGTAVWLGYVLQAHLPLWLIGVLGGGLILILFQLFLQKRLSWITLLLTLALGLGIPFLRPIDGGFSRLPELSHEGACMHLWCRFDEQVIPHMVKKGYVVLVDVTADWCVTCAANKKLVLEKSEVTQVLGDVNVIAMRADWTKQNPQITRFLQKHGRYGIPFNILFGPKVPEGVVLPELLTVHEVLSAFEKVGYKTENK